MRKILQLTGLCVLCSLLAVVVLLSGAPNSAAQNAPTGQRQGAAANSSTPAVKSPNVAGDIGATQFIDLARLVLESSRDQAASTAFLIERATTVIVVFFTVVGAAGAFFGWMKIAEVRQQAVTVVQAFQNDLDGLRSSAQNLQSEFERGIAAATSQMRVEINAQAELLAARSEMDHANYFTDTVEQNRYRQNAVRRIEKVLEDCAQVSYAAQIRGMADLAYISKRLGDLPKALETALRAANLAKQHEPSMLHLLAFNCACYSARSQREEGEIQAWLTEAIKLKPEYKAAAAADEDFARFKDAEWFKNLTA